LTGGEDGNERYAHHREWRKKSRVSLHLGLQVKPAGVFLHCLTRLSLSERGLRMGHAARLKRAAQKYSNKRYLRG
jgi:hypothetical protein